MRQYNIWCVCVRPVWRGMHTSPHRTHAHTPNFMLPHHHIDVFTFLTNFNISTFNKEHTNFLKMI